MKSYTTLRATYGVDTKNTASANLTQGDEWMNDYHRKLLSKADWPFLHKVREITSYAPTSTITAAVTGIITATGTILTITGTEVKFSTTGTLPSGLSTDTTYYMIYQSATTFKVATSMANALAGTAVTIADTGTGTHTAEIQTIMQPLPYDVDLIESVYVIVSGQRYTPQPCPSRKMWDQLNSSDQSTTTPAWWFVYDGEIGLYPRLSDAGYVIGLNCKIRVPDLNIANYTTGTVDIVTNGSHKVTGSGTSWTTPMVGRWIRITHSDTAASSGDGEWYQISAIESTTVLYLDRPCGGRSLTTGASAAYIIGQMPLLPEAYHDLPEIYAAFRYWLKEDDTRATEFRNLLIDGQNELMQSYGVNDLSMVLDSGEDEPYINPNLYINL